jgi:lipoprotein-anchoring transpeptidase ErfK/SrfK
MTHPKHVLIVVALATCGVGLATFPSSAEPYALAAPNAPNVYPSSVFEPVLRNDPRSRGDVVQDETLAPRLRRQMVSYPTREAPGTIVIDTPNTYLYLVLGGGQALRYGIGVGREGFTWSGVETISRAAEWPDWFPPAEMIARQPYLPRFMAGGPGNPLGARALYLGNSAYRIHGTNDPTTIGHQVSSGCIRLTNEDVSDLYGRVHPGTKVVVLPQASHHQAPVAQIERTPPAARVAAPARAVAIIPVSTTGAAPRVSTRSEPGFAFGLH